MLAMATAYINLIRSRSRSILTKYPKLVINHYAITFIGAHSDVKPIDVDHNFDMNTIAFQTTFSLKENGEEVVFVATTPGPTLCGENSGCIRPYVMFAPRSSDLVRYSDFMWEILTEIYGVYPKSALDGLADDILLVTGKMPAPNLSIDYLKKYAPNKKRKSVVSLQ